MPIDITFAEDGTKNIKLPKNFRASSAHRFELRDVLEAMHSISVSANKYRTPIHLDMSEVVELNAASALLIFAYVTSAQLVNRKGDFVQITLPKDPKTKQLVRNSGLWDAIKSGTDRKLDRNWLTANNFQSGYDPDRHLDLTLDLLEAKWGTLPKNLSVAINEAMLNIKQHAYVINPEHTIARWWQYIYIKNNELHFLIFDKGLGIPSSFRRVGLKRRSTDEQIVAHAMERYVTSTQVEGRGNGSMNIKKPVTQVDQDILLLLSEKGGYRYNKDGDVTTFPLPLGLTGTLVAWKIGLADDRD